MSLPPKLKQKYLNRLIELIEIGESLPLVDAKKWKSTNSLTGEVRYNHYKLVKLEEFTEWQANSITILDQIIPIGSIHRSTVEEFKKFKNSPTLLKKGVSYLKSTRYTLENGFLTNILSDVEAELSADYMGQAEQLLNEGVSGKYEHVPAAVLTGAVLEKSLKSICTTLEPPEELKDNGKHVKLNALIDILKKRGVYNELVAKQLRAWAAIRNDAAHGNFDEFTKEQVAEMISGVKGFISNHLQ